MFESINAIGFYENLWCFIPYRGTNKREHVLEIRMYLEIFAICKLSFLFLVVIIFSGFCWWTWMLDHFLLVSLYLAILQFFAILQILLVSLLFLISINAFLCGFVRLFQSFIFKFLLRMWLTFWLRHSTSVSLETSRHQF